MLTIRFDHERSTPNTERFSEIRATGEAAQVPILYVQRWALESEGFVKGDGLEITLTVVKAKQE